MKCFICKKEKINLDRGFICSKCSNVALIKKMNAFREYNLNRSKTSLEAQRLKLCEFCKRRYRPYKTAKETQRFCSSKCKSKYYEKKRIS